MGSVWEASVGVGWEAAGPLGVGRGGLGEIWEPSVSKRVASCRRDERTLWAELLNKGAIPYQLRKTT